MIRKSKCSSVRVDPLAENRRKEKKSAQQQDYWDMIIGSWRMWSLEAVANFESADKSGEDDLVEREMEGFSRGSILKVTALLTLRVHRSALVWRVWVVGRVGHLSIVLVDHPSARGTAVWARDLAVGGLISDRRKLGTNTTAVGRWLSMRRVGGVGSFDLVGLDGLSGGTLTLLDSLALSLFFLLAGFPFLADFLELWETSMSANQAQNRIACWVGASGKGWAELPT